MQNILEMQYIYWPTSEFICVCPWTDNPSKKGKKTNAKKDYYFFANF